MQTNEHVGQVKYGPRRGRVKQAHTAMREAPEAQAQAQGLSAGESNPRAPRPPTRKPQLYGAGF